MTRDEFCNLLLDNRKKSGCKMKDICFALEVMPTAIYRLEKGNNSFNVVIALKYINAINCKMVLTFNGKPHTILSYNDLVNYIKEARSGSISQRDLSEQIGTSYSHLANIELSKMIVGVDIFLKLMDVLNITISIKPR